MFSPELYGWFAGVQLLAALALIAFVAYAHVDPERLYCPGPRQSWASWLNPRRWFFRRACWYNLTGLPPRDDGSVRCPECGAISRPNQRLRAGRRWRPLSFAALCFVLSAVSVGLPWLRAGSWTPVVPTLALIGLEDFCAARQPRALRNELYERTTSGNVHGYSARLLAAKLADDLHDDHKRWNATRAVDMLEALWPDSRPALEHTLLDRDRQARLIAADILRRHCALDPSDPLLAACVEDLRSDLKCYDYWTCYNAQSAAEFLCACPDRIEPFLRPALASDDWQQRVLAAAVAGYARVESLLDLAAPILIEQLKDDHIRGNAKIAAPALYHFGPQVIPYLEPCCDSGDGQLRASARAIIARLRSPDSLPRQSERSMPRITEVTDDPLLNLSISDGIRDLP